MVTAVQHNMCAPLTKCSPSCCTVATQSAIVVAFRE